MKNDRYARVLYQSIEILGVQVTVYECGEPPVDDNGDYSIDALFNQTFLTDRSNKDVFYEAYITGTNKVFYTSKIPPTDEELIFQLKKHQQEAPLKLIGWVILCVAVIYFIFK